MSSNTPVHIPHSERYPNQTYSELQSFPVDEYDEGNINLLQYWRVLVTRRWTIAAIVLTSVVVTLIWTLRQTPMYQATTTIEIGRDIPDVLPFKDVYEAQAGTDDTLRT